MVQCLVRIIIMHLYSDICKHIKQYMQCGVAKIYVYSNIIQIKVNIIRTIVNIIKTIVNIIRTMVNIINIIYNIINSK